MKRLPENFLAVTDADGCNCGLQSEAEASYYHTHKMISTASLESQTVQADALFTTKLETRYKMHPKNKTAAGILLSRLKEDGGLPTKVFAAANPILPCVACYCKCLPSLSGQG